MFLVPEIVCEPWTTIRAFLDFGALEQHPSLPDGNAMNKVPEYSID
jgi:hypothetical protein